jgi:hypothetical protein
MKIWDWWVEWCNRLPRPAHPKITLQNLRWNLEVRVIPNKDMRYGAGLKFSNSQCRDLLDILNTNTFAKAAASVHREQKMMQRLQEHNVGFPPYGCTWNRCIVPCESQAEHDGKEGKYE